MHRYQMKMMKMVMVPLLNTILYRIGNDMIFSGLLKQLSLVGLYKGVVLLDTSLLQSSSASDTLLVPSVPPCGTAVRVHSEEGGEGHRTP